MTILVEYPQYSRMVTPGRVSGQSLGINGSMGWLIGSWFAVGSGGFHLKMGYGGPDVGVAQIATTLLMKKKFFHSVPLHHTLPPQDTHTSGEEEKKTNIDAGFAACSTTVHPFCYILIVFPLLSFLTPRVLF
jgi:hypothetical protein